MEILDNGVDQDERYAYGTANDTWPLAQHGRPVCCDRTVRNGSNLTNVIPSTKWECRRDA